MEGYEKRHKNHSGVNRKCLTKRGLKYVIFLFKKKIVISLDYSEEKIMGTTDFFYLAVAENGTVTSDWLTVRLVTE